MVPNTLCTFEHSHPRSPPCTEHFVCTAICVLDLAVGNSGVLRKFEVYQERSANRKSNATDSKLRGPYHPYVIHFLHRIYQKG